MKRFLTFVLFASIFLSVCVFTQAKDESEFDITNYNSIFRISGIGVFDSAFGETTQTKSGSLELTVDNGVISAIGEYNSEIPKFGYVISVRGDDQKAKFSTFKVGDACIIDIDNMKITFPTEGYDPFYENTISFDKYNSTRVANSIIIYNKGETTNTNIWGNEAVVDKDGFVVSVGGNNNAIPEGGFVISAVGSGRIDELNNAVAIGLKAEIDDNKKTITFKYNAESIKASLGIKFDDSKAMFNNAKESFLIFDENAAKDHLKKLESISNSVIECLENDNLGKAVALSKAFDKYYALNYMFFSEHPAVEARGIWVRPLEIKNEKDVNKMVSEIKEMGFNLICLEMFFDSTFICPMPSDGYFIHNPSFNGFDVLGAFIKECREQEIELQGWLPVYRVSYSTSTYYSQSLAAKKPEWLCVNKNGVDYVANEYGNGYFIDPSNKEATAYLLSAYEYILKTYNLDGLHLDYIRYPHQTGEEFGYNEGALNAFIEKYGKDPKTIVKDGELWDEWVSFRCDFVTEMVRSIVEIAKTQSPETAISAAVAPNIETSRETHLQDAKAWMNEGLIEMAFPMAYGPNVVDMYAGYTVEASKNNGYSYIGFGDYGPDIFTKQILEAREVGAEGFAFFSYAQYINGGYKKIIANNILSIPAISPSYNAKKAALVQLEVIAKRLELFGDQAEFLELVTSLSKKLDTSSITSLATDFETLFNKVFSSDDSIKIQKFEDDISVLKRIVNYSHDDSREFKEEIVDTSSSTSSAQEENSSNNESNKDNNNTLWIIISVVSVIILLAIVISIIIFKKKH